MQNKKLLIAAAVFWIAVWQIAAVMVGHKLLLASPLDTAAALAGLCVTSIFWKSLFNSFFRIMLGFILGTAAGALLAAVSASSRPVRILVSPLMTVIRAIPVASFIILVLLWIRSAELSTVIAFLMVCPVIYTNVLQGFDSRDGELKEMAKVFRLSRAKQLRYLTLPQLAPWFSGACRTAVGLAWKSGIAAEVIGFPSGTIGDRLYQTKLYLETGELFAWTFMIVLMAALCEKVIVAAVSAVERRLAQ